MATVAAGCAGEAGPAVTAAVAAEVKVDPPPGAIALAGDGTVWATASTASRPSRREPRRHAIVRVDGDDAEVTGTVAVPHQMSDVTAGADAVWAVGTDFPDDGAEPRGTLVKLDPATVEIVTHVDLGVGAPSSVAVGHGAVWVTDSREDALIRLDPGSAEVVGRISVSGGPTSVAVDDRWVWVASPTTGTVHRVDPSTNVPEEQVLTGGLPSVVTAGGGAVWISNYADEDLALVDPDAVQVTRSVDFGSSASRLATDGARTAVVESEDRRLSLMLTPQDDPVVVASDRFFVDVAMRGDTVWAVDHGSDELVRLDLRVGG